MMKLKLNLKTLIVKTLLATLTIFFASCDPDFVDVEFNPDFYVGDYENRQIINELGQVVSSSDPIFNSYFCLSEGKVKELADIIARAKLPAKAKKKLLKLLDIGDINEDDDFDFDDNGQSNFM